MIRVANQADDAVTLGGEQPRQPQRNLSMGPCNRHVHGAISTSFLGSFRIITALAEPDGRAGLVTAIYVAGYSRAADPAG